MNNWLKYSTLGVQLVAAILLLGGLGYWADGQWGTQPWLLLTGCLLGIAVGLWQVVKAMNDRR